MFGRKLSKFSTKDCPLCHSSQVRRTRRRSFERLLLPFTAACLCNECGQRFYTIARVFRRHSEAHNTMKIRSIPKSGTASIP